MITKRLAPIGFAATRHLVHYYVRLPIGAAGAVGTPTGRGLTAAHGAAGVYTFTIQGQNGVGAILYVNAAVVSATKQSATVTSAVASTGIITINCAAASAPNTAADPGDGDAIMITVVCRNSSADSS